MINNFQVFINKQIKVMKSLIILQNLYFFNL